jgi:hypothetical protein
MPPAPCEVRRHSVREAVSQLVVPELVLLHPLRSASNLAPVVTKPLLEGVTIHRHGLVPSPTEFFSVPCGALGWEAGVSRRYMARVEGGQTSTGLMPLPGSPPCSKSSPSNCRGVRGADEVSTAHRWGPGIPSCQWTGRPFLLDSRTVLWFREGVALSSASDSRAVGSVRRRKRQV